MASGLRAGVDYPIGGKPTHKQIDRRNKDIAQQQRHELQPQRLKKDRRIAKREAKRAEKRHPPVVIERVNLPINCHSILGVSMDADLSTIKAAYRKLALKWHPDKTPNNARACEMFRMVTDAYATLTQ